MAVNGGTCFLPGSLVVERLNHNQVVAGSIPALANSEKVESKATVHLKTNSLRE